MLLKRRELASFIAWTWAPLARPQPAGCKSLDVQNLCNVDSRADGQHCATWPREDHRSAHSLVAHEGTASIACFDRNAGEACCPA